MRSWESLKIALRSLRANKLRSGLTMLGIIIGVASVVAMIAVGSGAQTQISEQIRTLGANVLMILPGAARRGGGTTQTLTESDAEVVLSQSPYILAAAPSVRGDAQLVAGNRNWSTQVNGTTPAYFTVREWGLAEGRYFSERNLASAENVVVIGQTVAEKLFGAETSALGRTVRIRQVPFTVIGMLAQKGLSGTGRDQDDIAFIPISTAKIKLFGSRHQANRESVEYILVKARSDDVMDLAQREITALLRQRHRVQVDAADDFRVTDPATAMAAKTAASRTIAWLLASLASVSLVVGGISIMNIMLVAVSERTREIGLRMAVGARPRDIRDQFLLEAVTLCMLGGLVGVLIGIGVSVAVAEIAGWPVFLSPEAMFAALGFAAAVGIFFGYYPARRASVMDPIECLRME